MSYDVLDLSKYIVTKCNKDGCPISNLQLQNILYAIQKDFLIRDSIAFFDDIEAWHTGPVVPNVYYKFCSFGAHTISFTYEEAKIERKDARVIDTIIESQRSKSFFEFVKENRVSGGAWDQTFKDGSGLNCVITLDKIISYSKKRGLDDQIQSASSRAAESHTNDKALTKEPAPDR